MLRIHHVGVMSVHPTSFAVQSMLAAGEITPYFLQITLGQIYLSKKKAKCLLEACSRKFRPGKFVRNWG